jgi:hypothetical protein
LLFTYSVFSFIQNFIRSIVPLLDILLLVLVDTALALLFISNKETKVPEFRVTI